MLHMLLPLCIDLVKLWIVSLRTNLEDCCTLLKDLRQVWQAKKQCAYCHD
ncbi:hypothetical protein Zm00014a_028821 [Zea mays]|uniref:Uncharacterized protein n=1 Tax=Zea mays TaxID=4577 RepID=A0A3L6F1B4_MAIZE|nr:hypothetical protein Zm00014a_028821 [Zea mays]